jgi:5-methyltetrahydropteroyltriglutamate--homocysteine methyltransferase
MKFPMLPTTLVGSYSLPHWLEGAQEAGKEKRLTEAQLEEAYDNAVKSCIKDQEAAGLDVITDGELRRETMVYFFSKRIHGFDNTGKMKAIGNLDPSIQMPDPVIVDKIRRSGSIGMAKHFSFLKKYAAAHPKVTITGPQMLAKRATNEYYKDEKELIFDLAGVLNVELKEVVDAGCEFIQVDEPVWVGYPEDMPWLVEAFNKMVDGVKAKIALHVCYGNYKLKKLFTGTYADLFPEILKVNASQLSLEFAVSDMEPLQLFKDYKTNMEVAVGVVDVKDEKVETAEVVADRIRRALKVIPKEKIWTTTDCGMKFMPRDRAFGKLKALVDGTKIVRKELGA